MPDAARDGFERAGAPCPEDDGRPGGGEGLGGCRADSLAGADDERHPAAHRWGHGLIPDMLLAFHWPTPKSSISKDTISNA
jgi:hypothetical protein